MSSSSVTKFGEKSMFFNTITVTPRLWEWSATVAWVQVTIARWHLMRKNTSNFFPKHKNSFIAEWIQSFVENILKTIFYSTAKRMKPNTENLCAM